MILVIIRTVQLTKYYDYYGIVQLVPYKIECANHQVYNRLNMSNLEDNKDQMPGPDYSGIKSFYIYASQNSQNDVAKSPSVQLSQ